MISKHKCAETKLKENNYFTVMYGLVISVSHIPLLKLV